MQDQHSANGWDRIGGVRSDSNPAKFYIVSLRTSGYIGCDCPSMKYRKGTKPYGGFEATCKHIRALLDESFGRDDFDATTFGMTWLAKRTAARLAKEGAGKKVA
jgi:hypothetical protein